MIYLLLLLLSLLYDSSKVTSSRTLQTFSQQGTVTNCLLFILQPIYLHNLSITHLRNAQVVEMSVTNNSPSLDSNHPDDLFQSKYVTAGFKAFS